MEFVQREQHWFAKMGQLLNRQSGRDNSRFVVGGKRFRAKSLRVVFLDVDGVLNTRDDTSLSPTMVKRVAKLCQECNAQIVLSTTWRVNSKHKAELLAVLQEHGGIDSNVIIGDTPELAEPDDGDFEPTDSSNDWGMLTQANVYFTRTRVSELRLWVRQHRQVLYSWVALDDMHLGRDLRIGGRAVLTDPTQGFTAELYDVAKDVLQSPMDMDPLPLSSQERASLAADHAEADKDPKLAQRLHDVRKGLHLQNHLEATMVGAHRIKPAPPAKAGAPAAATGAGGGAGASSVSSMAAGAGAGAGVAADGGDGEAAALVDEPSSVTIASPLGEGSYGGSDGVDNDNATGATAGGAAAADAVATVDAATEEQPQEAPKGSVAVDAIGVDVES